MNFSSTMTLDSYPINPDQLPAIPRKADTTTLANWKRGLLLAILLLVPNGILLYGLIDGKNLRDLIDHGKTAMGRIVDRKTQYHSRGGTSYHIRYRYEAEGHTYEGEASVAKKVYEELLNGTQREITYLPEQPWVSCLGKPDPWQKQRINTILMLAGVAAILLVGWLGWVEFQVQRELKLIRSGVGVVGMVIDRGSTRSKNGMRYWVKYQFTGQDQYERTGTNTIAREIWDELELGTSVTVLYDPDSPGINRPLYAFKNVRCLKPVNDEGEPVSSRGW